MENITTIKNSKEIQRFLIDLGYTWGDGCKKTKHENGYLQINHFWKSFYDTGKKEKETSIKHLLMILAKKGYLIAGIALKDICEYCENKERECTCEDTICPDCEMYPEDSICEKCREEEKRACEKEIESLLDELKQLNEKKQEIKEKIAYLDYVIRNG